MTKLRRHWALWAVCAVFLCVGAFALDDYGVGLDERAHRAVGRLTLDSLTGNGESALSQLTNPHDRYSGAPLEASLVLAERILGLEDSRDVFLARHFLTHLFFLAGGVFCYLLVLRLFNNRLLALVAMALFLLHPRLYAHSFPNTKDVPFLAMFMIALFFTHRAFRRDTLGAFLLCGAGVGLLVNLRVMGIILFAAVLALRALDLSFVGSADGRKRVLLTGAGFALAAMLAYHASLPALWADPPGRFLEILGVLRNHPVDYYNLFRGEWLYSRDGPPFAYVPVWVGITTPPATLLLAAAGAVALAWRGLRRPRALLRDGPARFGLLLLAIPIVTVFAVVMLENNVFAGWRYLYFLYAPLLLLAVFGLHGLTRALRGRRPQAGTYALAGTALAVAVVSMARIHPHQDSYFNALADRATPERLTSRYDVDIGHLSFRSVLDRITADHPSADLHVAFSVLPESWRILPPDDRGRLIRTRDFHSGERNFLQLLDRRACPVPVPGNARVHVVAVYASSLSCVVDPVAYFGALRREALGAEPLDRSRFDAWRVGDTMVYVRDECAREDLDARVFLRVYPADPVDLPEYLRNFPGHRVAYGFEKRDFDFRHYGARIDGDCVAAVPLPDYPIARIETGQYTQVRAEAARRAVAEAEPLARAHFDLYLDPHGHRLTYVRDGCSAEDADTRFFLHVHPADPANLPVQRARHGFDNLNFGLRQQGARTDDGACVAVVPLPRYPATVRTGQFTAAGRLWETEIAVPE